MKRIGNGPELMADLVAKLAVRGTSPVNEHRRESISTSHMSMKKPSYYKRQVIIIALILSDPVYSAL
jgi:hypothetical protein